MREAVSGEHDVQRHLHAADSAVGDARVQKVQVATPQQRHDNIRQELYWADRPEHRRARHAGKPVQERGEIEDAATTEMARISDMASVQAIAMQISIEFGQYRVNPSSHHEIY
jgi:hypothetical protein